MTYRAAHNPGGGSGAAVPVGIGWRHAHYGELLERRPVLDFLEVHSENFFAEGGAALAVLEAGRSHYPISLHGVGLSLGAAAGLDPWHLDQLGRLVHRIDPVRVSDHAAFARGAFQGRLVHGADLLPIPFNAEALDTLCAHVQQVQDRLQRIFMVENLSAYVQWRVADDEQVESETSFLSALARRTGCHLLVDVNNIYVNALNRQVREGVQDDPLQVCRQWLDGIAPKAVGEIHLAGHCQVHDAVHGDIVIDDHGSRVGEQVWELYQYAVQRFGPVPTLMEWDTDIPTLDVLLHEADLARTHGAAIQAPKAHVPGTTTVRGTLA